MLVHGGLIMDEKLVKKGLFGFLVLAVAIGLVITAGCTGSSDTTTSDSGASSAQQTQDTGTSSSVPVSSGEAVHYTTLIQYLPTAPSTGWTNGDPVGMQASDGGYSWSWASKNYEQKTSDAVVDIVIEDTNNALVGQMAGWDSYMEIETPVMSMKSVTVAGYPGWVVTDTESDTISQIVKVDDRFIVYTVIEDGKEDYLTVFNGLTDFKGIAGLA